DNHCTYIFISHHHICLEWEFHSCFLSANGHPLFSVHFPCWCCIKYSFFFFAYRVNLSDGYRTPFFIDSHHRQKRFCCQAFRSLDDVMRSKDRKSTRLNSSHVSISYAVFCLKK